MPRSPAKTASQQSSSSAHEHRAHQVQPTVCLDHKRGKKAFEIMEEEGL